MSGSDQSRVFNVAPGGRLTGTIRVPGDKSISHRAVMFGSIADGVTEVRGLLEGEDVKATAAVFREAGVSMRTFQENGRDVLEITGVGVDGLSGLNGKSLDLGNSGTAMRLLTGLFAGAGVQVTLTGDESLSGRPMGRVVTPLTSMGASIATADNGRPPLRLNSRDERLRAIEYTSPLASAQVKSAVLLAGLAGDGTTVVNEPATTRDHTERMLRAFGVPVHSKGTEISIDGGHRLTASNVDVPSDISSATFFLVGASIATGSEITLVNVGVNPTRDGVLTILGLMGADIERTNERMLGDEPVADLVVRSAPLKGIDVPPELVPLAIDEFPALAVAAAVATGTTRVTGAGELRVKESDRIGAVVAGLRALGVCCEELDDGMVIEGGQIAGGNADSKGDHRLAMAFAMAGLVSDGPVRVDDVANVATSFPAFESLARDAGLGVELCSAGASS